MTTMICSETIMEEFLSKVITRPGVYMGYIQSRTKYGATKDEMLTRTPFRFDVGRHTTARIIATITAAAKECIKDSDLASTSVIYVSTNPRDVAEAEHKLVTEILEHRYVKSKTAVKCPDWGSRWSSLLTSSSDSSIRNSEMWWTIDIDLNDVKELVLTLQQVRAVLDPKHLQEVREDGWVVSTHGGWHVLIRGKYLTKAAKSQLHKDFTPRKFSGKDKNGREIQKSVVNIKPDVNCPMPGTRQGGRFVTFISLSEYTVHWSK